MRPTLLIPPALALACAAAALAGAAEAQRPRAEAARRAGVLDALSACRRETDGAARLACYDRAAGALEEAEGKGQLVVLDKEQVRTVRRQAFGFEIPSFGRFFRPGGRAERSDPEEAIDRVTYTLSGTGGGGGRYVFYTTEGVNWVQTDDELPRPPRAGAELRVRRAALGSYFCNVDGQRAVRCQRQR